eukprot:4060068-Amphidinium_carterae.1
MDAAPRTIHHQDGLTSFERNFNRLLPTSVNFGECVRAGSTRNCNKKRATDVRRCLAWKGQHGITNGSSWANYNL